MARYLGDKLIASVGGDYHPNTFECKWSDHLINDIQWLRADTFSWQSGEVYTTAYNKLVEEFSTGTVEIEDGISFMRSSNGFKIVTEDKEQLVLEKYNTDGTAWYYILDIKNKRFKLPRTKWGFKGFRDVVGADILESLPNIKGSTGVNTTDGYAGLGNFNTYSTHKTNTPIQYEYNVYSIPLGAGGTGDTYRTIKNISIDASKSSSAYQDNAPVQERATQMYLYFYVGEYAREAIEQTAGINTEMFNGKVDLNASNLNAAGREYVSGLGMPSSRYIDLNLGASGTQYTAPANGYFYIRKISGASGQFVWLQNASAGNLAGALNSATVSSQYLSAFVPVKKNHIAAVEYNATGSTQFFRFIYAEGEQI